MLKNRLFVEPDGDSDNNERIAGLIDAGELFTAKYPIIGGGFANVVEVTERNLITLIKNRTQGNVKFNAFEKPADQHKLRRIEVAVSNEHLTVQQVLNRRVQKKLVKIKLQAHSTVSVEYTPEKLEKLKVVQRSLL